MGGGGGGGGGGRIKALFLQRLLIKRGRAGSRGWYYFLSFGYGYGAGPRSRTGVSRHQAAAPDANARVARRVAVGLMLLYAKIEG